MTNGTVCEASTITRIDRSEAMAIAAEIGGQCWWDGMNQLQVRDREQLTVSELLAEWEAISIKAVKARNGMPRTIAAHDGRILTDYIAEWAGTHGKPFVLELSGPAGGTFESGNGGERVEMDAIEFIRVLAERAEGPGVLQHKLPL